jgi:adenine-specific DNA methylase
VSNAAHRAVPRYAAHPPLDGEFGGTPVTLLNLSVAGAMIRHHNALPIGSESALQLRAQGGAMVELYAEVVWTRRDEPGAICLSGIRFTEWIEVAQRAIDELIGSGAVRLDASAPPDRLDD